MPLAVGDGSTVPQWAREREQAQLQATKLSPELEKYAAIINDTTGAYSDADEVDAYTSVESSREYAIGRKGGMTQEEFNQFHKFEVIIAGSKVGRAVADGFQKLEDAEATKDLDNDADRLQFFSGLSDLQKKLPVFKDFGTPLVVLFRQAAERSRQDPISLSDDAQRLTGLLADGSRAARPT